MNISESDAACKITHLIEDLSKALISKWQGERERVQRLFDNELLPNPDL